MLKAVKYSFVVENSQAHMKKYANFMTDSNDNFGVMKILDKVLRSKKSKL
jgi:hydroxymethylpyrimidine pyrophosphatase-like HAD family hydrolase